MSNLTPACATVSVIAAKFIETFQTWADGCSEPRAMRADAVTLARSMQILAPEFLPEVFGDFLVCEKLLREQERPDGRENMWFTKAQDALIAAGHRVVAEIGTVTWLKIAPWR